MIVIMKMSFQEEVSAVHGVILSIPFFGGSGGSLGFILFENGCLCVVYVTYLLYDLMLSPFL